MRRQEKEERLGAEANSLMHRCLHLPLNPFCPDCAAKKKAQPARCKRRDDPEMAQQPDQFGDM
eukprot:4433692-Heterocapsa_arctica.AAC.1